ncbi:MAG: hypothetical protein DMG05_12230 [Acidobacteria bacterium]|nr:MAG: hypothetical protein DMG05_12230 [Acidobacteriota bacterium]
MLTNLRRMEIFFAILIMAYVFMAWKASNRISQGNSDFIIYYTAAQMIKEDQGQSLYDLALQKQFQQKILSAIHFQEELLPYNHPPFELIWFRPLARFPYLTAFLLWDTFSFICFGLGLMVLIKGSGPHNGEGAVFVILGSLAFLPLFVTLLQGQDSAMVFLFLVLTFINLKKLRDARAGLCLSLVLQKFQILIPILFLLLAKKRWKVLGGFLAGGGVTLLISLNMVGINGLKRYLLLVIEMATWVNHYGIYPSTMHCLRGQIYAFWFESHPNLAMGITIATVVSMLGLLFKVWKGKWDVHEPTYDLKFALLILISLLVSPHVNFHDLSLLLLPAVLIFQFLLREPNVSSQTRLTSIALFLVCFPLLLSTLIVSNLVPIQLSVWGLLALTGLVMHQLKVFEIVRK